MQIIHLTSSRVEQAQRVPTRRQVLAIGDFDGVHLGHQEVIKRALKTAADLRIPASIMTFHPHPREVLGQYKYTQLLTPMKRKMELLEQLGVEYAYIVTFDEELMRLTPEHFIESVLLPLGVETVIVGFDFTFGYQGKGTPDTLCELSHGQFTVEVVHPFHHDGEKVSSTSIRNALVEGDILKVNQLLGRCYSMDGTVVHGDARGKTIGFPTANIELHESYVVPTNGVYAVKVNIDGKTYEGVMNIGVKPTFTSGELKPKLEAHLFDFSQDIYGAAVSIDLVSFLRKEKKFASIEELISQIKQDIEQAKAQLFNLS